MQTTRSIYRGFCSPPEVIAHAVFLYHRFPLSLRDVEDLLAQRGIAVSYETIRRWCRRFGPHYARNVRRQRPTAADHWLLDEVFLQIQGRRQYLWRAIDQDGDILDILMQRRRNGRAATRFVRKLLKQQQRSPNRFVTDKLGSYRVWCNKEAEASLVAGRSAAHGPCREPPPSPVSGGRRAAPLSHRQMRILSIGLVGWPRTDVWSAASGGAETSSQFRDGRRRAPFRPTSATIPGERARFRPLAPPVAVWAALCGGVAGVWGVVARIVTGPHDANRQDPHLPMRYDAGRPADGVRVALPR